MAKLSIDLDDFQEGNLPPVCICCGSPSCTTAERRFRPTPAWMLILNYLPLGRLWFSANSTHGKVPLCRKHKRRLTLGRRLAFIGYGFIAGLILTAVLALARGGPDGAPLLFLALLALLSLTVLLGPIVLYVDMTTPRVCSLESVAVTLESVSARFAKQVVDQSPQGLPTSAEALPSSENLPKIILGLALTLMFLPTALGFVAWGMAHLNREPVVAQNQNQSPHQNRPAPPNPLAASSTGPEMRPDEPTNTAPATPATRLPGSTSAESSDAPHGAAPAKFDPVMGGLLPATTGGRAATPAALTSEPSASPTPTSIPAPAPAPAPAPVEVKAAPDSVAERLSIEDAIVTLHRTHQRDGELDLSAWGEEAIPGVLSMINSRDPEKREAANELVEVLEISTAAVVEQCTADLDNSAMDNRLVAQRLAACKVEPESRVALGKALAQAITTRNVELEPLVEAFKNCVGHEHVPEIIDLLSEQQNGDVLDAGRAVAIHLRDPDVYPAVVRLIDVPFGDRRTAEVCREIGAAIEEPLWPYLANPRRARLVAEILGDIGTIKSIRPLTATANGTADKRVQQACAEAIAVIRQQGKARAQALAEQESLRLAGGDQTTDPTTEIEQPIRRTWTDRTGKFQRQGELVGVTETTASIRIDGKVIEIPIAQLSAADQAFLEEQN